MIKTLFQLLKSVWKCGSSVLQLEFVFSDEFQFQERLVGKDPRKHKLLWFWSSLLSNEESKFSIFERPAVFFQHSVYLLRQKFIDFLPRRPKTEKYSKPKNEKKTFMLRTFDALNSVRFFDAMGFFCSIPCF